MHWLDWCIVAIPMAVILWMAFYSGKYVRGVVDFLAAGRVAGRYVISVGDMTAGLSVIAIVAGSEQQYQSGFSISFWYSLIVPLGIVLSLTGFCSYRWRQARILSKGQFIELRYGSKFFRVVTAVVSTLSEMLTNALGPAIATNFFIYYLGLPHRIMICGISLPCYAIIVVMCLALALLIIWPGGRISLLVTDCFQGLLSYPIFVIIVGFFLLKFSWNVDVSPILWDRVPGQSFINPYDVAQLRDFNVFAIVVMLTTSVLNRASWYGNDTTNSGRTPHEQKMAGILGCWRNGFAPLMMLLLAMLTYVFMNSGNFSAHTAKNGFRVTNNEIRRHLSERVLEGVLEERDFVRANAAVKELPSVNHVIGEDEPLSQQKNLDTRFFKTVRKALGDTPKARKEFQQYRTLYQQMMMPVVLRNLLPVGMLGLFCLLMIMLLISTDDSRIFNSTACIVQDMILPFLKGRLSPKKHLLLLRFAALGVTLFFLAAALFFSQLDYINMVMTVMAGLWTGGAGPIMLFGLYTRFGNLTGAWCSLIFGSGTTLLGLIAQRNWAKWIYPFLERHDWVSPLNDFLVTVSSPFKPWIQWSMDPVKFPINSYEIFFIAMAMGVGSYIIGSCLTYKPYDLDKLLHRGKYSDNPGDAIERKISWSPISIFRMLIGITPEYTAADKVIAWSMFWYAAYKLLGTFVIVVIWNVFWPWPREWWNNYFYVVFLMVPGIVGIISTFWYLIGGAHDTFRLFKDLKLRVDDPSDNGQIG